MDPREQKRVAFITLGCAKNEVDTAHMTARLHQVGYQVMDWDDLQTASDRMNPPIDAIVINTCAFLQEAIEENLEVIFDIAAIPEVADKDTKLIVAGCLPSRFGIDLAEELQEADLFIPCAEEGVIVAKLDELFGIDPSPRSASPCAAADAPQSALELAAPRIDPGPSAYVKISDGCNRFCSFCAIPFIRGRYHSFTYERIHDEVAQLVAAGTREIVLIAQDTGIWGSDLVPERSLAWLLDSLASAFPDTWFRVLYIQPEHITTDLLDTIAAHSNICNYLDIPLQHVDETLLRAMNRRGSREAFTDLLALIRTRFPLIALRTTFIVGFPGETDELFDELCDFVAEADFDYVGVFAFSPEEGTKAADLPEQVDEEIKLERLRTLRELADTVSQTRLARFVGSKLDVLVLGREEDGQIFGRSHYQAPDVDGVTFVDEGAIGEIVPVRIEDTLYYEMEGSRAR